MRKLKIVILAIMLSMPSFASDKVSSPNVKKNVLEMEYRGGYDSDDDKLKDERFNSKFVFSYGLTDRIRPEIEFIYDDYGANDEKHLTVIETGLRYQFAKPEEAWLSSAIEMTYKSAQSDGKSDKLEVKSLFAKSFGNFNNLLNLSLESQVDEKSTGPSFKMGFSSTYKINDYFSPGFEFYMDTGDVYDSIPYDQQRYQIGPVLKGNISEKIKYEAGYIFGISEANPDGRAKLILAWSQKF